MHAVTIKSPDQMEEIGTRWLQDTLPSFIELARRHRARRALLAELQNLPEAALSDIGVPSAGLAALRNAPLI